MDAHPIDYAPAAPIHVGRRARRFTIGAAIVLVFGPVCWKAAPLGWRHAQLLYWQSRAMDYAAAPDQIVYDDDPRLVAQAAGGRQVPAWYNFYSNYSPPGHAPSATLFVHSRSARQEAPRLVVAEFRGPDYVLSPGPFTSRDDVQVSVWVSVIRPASATSNARELTQAPVCLALGRRGAVNHLRCFAGQVDPQDASHFAIAYELNGQDGVIDGWLRDNDTVTLERRQ